VEELRERNIQCTMIASLNKLIKCSTLEEVMLLLSGPRWENPDQHWASELWGTRERQALRKIIIPLCTAPPIYFLHMDEFVYICILFHLIICIEFKLK
jgi:hypothetical protein